MNHGGMYVKNNINKNYKNNNTIYVINFLKYYFIK